MKWRPAFGSTAQKTLAVPQRSPFVIPPRFSSWNRWRCRPQVSMQGDRLLIYADHRFLRVIRPLVHLKDVLHLGDIGIIQVGHHPHYFPATVSRSMAPTERIRMVSLPTRGTNLRLTASSATRRTVQRAHVGRTTAYHCNQTLFLALVEHFRCTLASAFPAVPAPSHLAGNGSQYCGHGLRSEWDQFGNLWGAGALGQLQQSQCA